jgi:hypothetical protein
MARGRDAETSRFSAAERNPAINLSIHTGTVQLDEKSLTVKVAGKP